ncbi:hypothetical protein GGP41_009661 [Bipolaris sorokiniana]|uniref:Uncharacterized protein n=1 Tax=Cochliobolus sativus TaxID=45130 RepID=A0A8H5ZBZ9_COCSA|nr:hypothetical protein GGP41_009661 [Bipolaris sorokiniana]
MITFLQPIRNLFPYYLISTVNASKLKSVVVSDYGTYSQDDGGDYTSQSTWNAPRNVAHVVPRLSGGRLQSNSRGKPEPRTATSIPVYEWFYVIGSSAPTKQK